MSIREPLLYAGPIRHRGYAADLMGDMPERIIITSSSSRRIRTIRARSRRRRLLVYQTLRDAPDDAQRPRQGNTAAQHAVCEVARPRRCHGLGLVVEEVHPALAVEYARRKDGVHHGRVPGAADEPQAEGARGAAHGDGGQEDLVEDFLSERREDGHCMFAMASFLLGGRGAFVLLLLLLLLPGKGLALLVAMADSADSTTMRRPVAWLQPTPLY
jgi:hypothetical protein